MNSTGHFRIPEELPFTSDEREVTILLGGLTWKHERLIRAVLQRNGYRSECLAQPDRDSHEIGKEYCGNGLCNPIYFMAGTVIKYLRELERDGMSPAEVVRRFVFFTAGSGGPCRFGMYEAEFRAAFAAAGFPGFRVILFLQDHGVNASSGQSGLRFSVDFGMSALHAFVLGDLLNDLHRKLSAYETVPGDAHRVIEEIVERLATYFRTAPYFDLEESAPHWLKSGLHRHRSAASFRTLNTLCKVYGHLYGRGLARELQNCEALISVVELDRLQVKPVVRVIGEFWAQLTEGDGNFRIFEFLENEGAEVGVEPISTWIMYLLHQAQRRLEVRRRIATHERPWSRPLSAMKERLAIAGKNAMYSIGNRIYRKHFQRLARALGNFSGPLTSQKKLAALAEPHYSTTLRGGEGHLEVAKNLYYTRSCKCHMVLAVKPFGCLPSMQSDAVQASLMEKNPEMIFLSVETAGEGEIHAYSRVQMALADAKSAARHEFNRTLSSTHRSAEEIRKFVLKHPELQSPLYQVSWHPGVISTAANFVLDVHALMNSSPDRPSNSSVLGQRSPERSLNDSHAIATGGE